MQAPGVESVEVELELPEHKLVASLASLLHFGHVKKIKTYTFFCRGINRLSCAKMLSCSEHHNIENVAFALTIFVGKTMLFLQEMDYIVLPKKSLENLFILSFCAKVVDATSFYTALSPEKGL